MIYLFILICSQVSTYLFKIPKLGVPISQVSSFEVCYLDTFKGIFSFIIYFIVINSMSQNSGKHIITYNHYKLMLYNMKLIPKKLIIK